MRFVAAGSNIAALPARFALALSFLVLFGGASSFAEITAQGVSPNEIIVGTHLDLSGPLKPWGTAVRNGLTMAIEEANKAGGINKRNVRLMVRDDAYDPAKAAGAARALAEQDRVFAILSPLGAPTSKAAMNQALSRGVLYLFPVTANEEAFLPLEPLKFAVSPTHTMEVQEGLRRMLNGRGALRTGLLATADAFGRAASQFIHEGNVGA